MKKYCIASIMIISLSVAFQQLRAQDPHFSQYFSSPSTVNPALVGKGVSDWRAMTTFRSQWWGASTAPFYTTAGSIEKAVYMGTSGSHLGIGLAFLTDASNSGLLKNNYFNASLSYNIALNSSGTDMFGIGLTAGYANRMLDGTKFEFQSQFGSMGFYRTSISGDPANALSSRYFDFNGGVHYSKSTSKWGYALGASVFHAGSPEESVYNNNTYNLPRRYVVHGSLYFVTKGKDEIHFSGISEIQSKNKIGTLGAMYKVKMENAALESVNLGLYDRLNDAIIPVLGLEAKTWMLSLSYDIINSDVRNYYNDVQSLEVAFSLRFGSRKNNSGAVRMIY